MPYPSIGGSACGARVRPPLVVRSNNTYLGASFPPSTHPTFRERKVTPDLSNKYGNPWASIRWGNPGKTLDGNAVQLAPPFLVCSRTADLSTDWAAIDRTLAQGPPGPPPLASDAEDWATVNTACVTGPCGPISPCTTAGCWKAPRTSCRTGAFNASTKACSNPWPRRLDRAKPPGLRFLGAWPLPMLEDSPYADVTQ